MLTACGNAPCCACCTVIHCAQRHDHDHDQHHDLMIRSVQMQCCAAKCTAVMCSLQWVFAHCSPPVIVLDELAGQPGLKMAWCAWLTLQIWQLLYLVSQEQSHVLHPLLACHLRIAMACLLPTSADRCSSTKAGLIVSQAKHQTVRVEAPSVVKGKQTAIKGRHPWQKSSDQKQRARGGLW